MKTPAETISATGHHSPELLDTAVEHRQSLCRMACPPGRYVENPSTQMVVLNIDPDIIRN